MDLEDLRRRIYALIDERDWRKFHTPQNVAIALSLEASEVLEHFQWTRTDESVDRANERRELLADEIADVAIYLIELCDLIDIDLESAIKRKLEKNALKYPVHLAKGSSKKYTELGTDDSS